jgi:aldehyde dehydrogenase (NAD+)
MDVSVRRIVWAKYFNAGQTCVAPDYALVHENVYDEFLVKMKA